MRRVVAGAVAATCSFGVAWAQAPPPGSLRNTVETVAGPELCAGRTVLDRAGSVVRALAVDPSGNYFVDTGAPEAGLVRHVDRLGPTLVTTGAPLRPPMSGSPPVEQDAPPSASRLASDRRGNLVLVAGAKVLRIKPTVQSADDPRVKDQQALTTLSGDASSLPGASGVSSTGDGGPGSDARFTSIRSVATDESGNVFVADAIEPSSATFRIRLINTGTGPLTVYEGTPHQLTIAPGHIDTIAGVPGATNGGDGGPARQATFAGSPPAMAAVQGKLYLGLHAGTPSGDGVDDRVRVVNLGGTAVRAHGVGLDPAAVDTVAGGRPSGFSGDGGPARAASFSYLPGLDADAEGNLYLADELHHRIRWIDRDGTITTFAGIGDTGRSDGGYNGNNRQATTARLNRPYDVKMGPERKVYISDANNGQVRMVDASAVIQAVPGNTPTWSCEGPGPGTPAAEGDVPLGGSTPASVAADSAGNVYFVNAATSQVMRRDTVGVISAIVGRVQRRPACVHPGMCEAEPPGGDLAATAHLDRPTALAVGPAGGVYVLESGGTRVRFANLTGDSLKVNGTRVAPGRLATVAGTGRPGLGGDDGPAVRAQMGGSTIEQAKVPSGAIEADGGGNLYVADPGNERVRMVDASGAISTVAGEGASASARDCCRAPAGLAADDRGNVYVADSRRVWYLNRGPEPVTVHGQHVPSGAGAPIAGNGGPASLGSDDAIDALDASLAQPTGLAAGGGHLFIADSRDARVRIVDESGQLNTVAGTGQKGFNGDGLDGRLTLLQAPHDVALDACGNLLISDFENGRLRLLHLRDSCSPAAIPATSAERRTPSWLVLAGAGAAAIGVALLVARTVRAKRPASAPPTRAPYPYSPILQGFLRFRGHTRRTRFPDGWRQNDT